MSFCPTRRAVLGAGPALCNNSEPGSSHEETQQRCAAILINAAQECLVFAGGWFSETYHDPCKQPLRVFPAPGQWLCLNRRTPMSVEAVTPQDTQLAGSFPVPLTEPLKAGISSILLCSVAQSRPAFREPVIVAPPGPSVRGISQAGTLEVDS